jgi:hypothetical protein
LTGFELRQALTSAGYTLNNHTLNILMHRYGNKDAEIEFDDFIMCAVKLKIMIGMCYLILFVFRFLNTFLFQNCLKKWLQIKTKLLFR